ncbi:MAG: hypothetical protein ACHQUC_07575 [Chlamydiales bacterium]
MPFKLSEYVNRHPYKYDRKQTFQVEQESWSRSLVIDKLTKIGHMQDKQVMWICSDLSTEESSPITRFVWTLFVKYFNWLRERFFGVNLDQSKEILSRIGKQIDKQDVRIVNLYNLAVQKFNSIAPRHVALALQYTFEDIKKNDYALLSQIDPQDYQSLYEEAVKESADQGIAFFQAIIPRFGLLNSYVFRFLRTALLAHTPEQLRNLLPCLERDHLTPVQFFTIAPFNDLKIEQLRVYTKGLTHFAITRLIWGVVEIVKKEASRSTIGSLYFGDSISFSDNFIRNWQYLVAKKIEMGRTDEDCESIFCNDLDKFPCLFNLKQPFLEVERSRSNLAKFL